MAPARCYLRLNEHRCHWPLARSARLSGRTIMLRKGTPLIPTGLSPLNEHRHDDVDAVVADVVSELRAVIVLRAVPAVAMSIITLTGARPERFGFDAGSAHVSRRHARWPEWR